MIPLVDWNVVRAGRGHLDGALGVLLCASTGEVGIVLGCPGAQRRPVDLSPLQLGTAGERHPAAIAGPEPRARG